MNYVFNSWIYVTIANYGVASHEQMSTFNLILNN